MDIVRSVQSVHITLTRLNGWKAREEFPDVVNRAAYGKERTIVSRRANDVAADVPMQDLRLLERLARQEMDRLDIVDARTTLKEAVQTGTTPLREPGAGIGGLIPGLPDRGHSRR